jgi:hypothetical protein
MYGLIIISINYLTYFLLLFVKQELKNSYLSTKHPFAAMAKCQEEALPTDVHIEAE